MARFEGLSPEEQWQAWEQVATDPRPRVATGWVSLDALLHRQSFGPGTLVILGGRMHTRKTAVMMNLIVNMLQARVPVGLVGLDEAPSMYVAKLASVITGRSHTELEEAWNEPSMRAVRDTYFSLTEGQLTITRGSRPSFDQLSGWLEVATVSTARPRVVFIDYLSRLARGKYAGKNTEHIPQLAEDLAEWTNQNELVTIVLHQVGRTDEGTNRKYHGDQPLTAEQLKYGGEEPADIVLGTFRPALDPIGNMTQDQAQAEGVDLDEWQEKADRVVATRDLTYLQLLKNRPGTQLAPKGIALRSVGLSQLMVPVDEQVGEDGVYRPIRRHNEQAPKQPAWQGKRGLP
jgi:hypothetical protein